VKLNQATHKKTNLNGSSLSLAEELAIANKELAFQNEEKEKRAAELIIANRALAMQYAEKEMQASELIRYKHFFYNNLDLACFANLDGFFEELNENFTKVLGYSSEDLLGRKFLEFIHPDDVETTIEVMGKLSQGFKVFNFVNRFRTKTNAYKYLEWNSVVNLETKKIYAISRDVTAAINAEIELYFQNQEKEKRAAELIVANKELVFQNEEKEKRAVELISANRELNFQNHEKEIRAVELSIAYKKLTNQNEEKAGRAAELIIANNELAFQNEEKEKRAAELIIANNELAFQNEEKEKRAAELIIANNELAFQNEEKEKRAAELVIANDELKKKEENLRKYIEGLEVMMYMTSHRVRQPVAHILGISNLLHLLSHSEEELKILVNYMKEAALALDDHTKEMTIFMSELELQAKNKKDELTI
jgi:PAS domain S-box-containing protein